MGESTESSSPASVALLTTIAAVAMLALTVGSTAAATHAGIVLTGAGAATPIPGDAMVGVTVFSAGAKMMPNGPGGIAAKAGVMG
ncbi:hypothetical protein [Haloarcula amylovorans]|uniref:hypothetical protein n=1 Tax=Haloarcula amylovorans TaxID=2562280 RepID=UPI001075FC21|nr:hypothetical protein [Halomicroarcula amylolytica]